MTSLIQPLIRIATLCIVVFLPFSLVCASDCEELTIIESGIADDYDINVRNIVALCISEGDTLEGDTLFFERTVVHDLNALEKTLFNHIINLQEDRNLPRIYHKQIYTKDGLKTLRGSEYYLFIVFGGNTIRTDSPAYIMAIVLYRRLLESLREYGAMQNFHLNYTQLNDEEKRVIDELYPACIYVEHTTPPPPPPPSFSI